MDTEIKSKTFLSVLKEIIQIVIVALVIVVPIRYFLFQPFFIRGQSMEPSFHDGDYLIIDEITYRLRAPQRGEVVVFKYPNNTAIRYIKRIVGLPGETIEIKDGEIKIIKGESNWVLDEESYLSSLIETQGNIRLKLSDDEYFVLGDNRAVSSDSRRWGVLPAEDIIGRAYLRAWPTDALAKIETPDY